MKLQLNMIAFVLVITSCSESPQPESKNSASSENISPIATPAFPDIGTLSGLMTSGETTSSAIIADLTARAGEYASLKALITLDAKGAATRAAELDTMRLDNNLLGALHGIPLVVKDNIHVAGLPNTAGTPGLRNFVPEMSNETINRLVAAGAIILAKANLHEMAFGVTSNNGAFGAVKNPYDQQMIAGGSSGGTAAAVSAGLVPAGLGTDTGGSARVPASLAGVVGFRPSMGRYPSTRVTPISHTRDTVGLISRSVDDLIVLDTVIAADNDEVANRQPDSIRLGVPRAHYYDNLDAQTAAVVETTLSALADAGVHLVEMEIPYVTDLHANSAFPIVLYEVAREIPAYLDEYDTGLTMAELTALAGSPDVKGILGSLSIENGITDDGYAAGLEARELLRNNFQNQFDMHNLDAIIYPTTPLPARPLADNMETVELNGEQVPTFTTYIRNAEPSAVAGLPGISLPAGLTDSGLPVGIEIDGPEQSDRQLLAVAKTLEAIIGFDDRPSKGNKTP